jgi:predicted DNA-binding ribbon-helix-helix protein
MPSPTAKERVRDQVVKAGQTRYEEDPYTWALEQCSLLKAGQFDLLDIDNLIDEVGDVARREFDSLVSALRVLLMHLLKWDHQPELRSRSWALTIAEQRDSVATIMKDNPGLKPRRGEAIERAYRRARLRAAQETGLDVEVFPRECSYPWDDITAREIEFAAAPR